MPTNDGDTTLTREDHAALQAEGRERRDGDLADEGLGSGAAHCPTRTMTAGGPGLRVPPAPHDETSRSHGSWDDAQLALLR